MIGDQEANIKEAGAQDAGDAKVLTHILPGVPSLDCLEGAVGWPEGGQEEPGQVV